MEIREKSILVPGGGQKCGVTGEPKQECGCTKKNGQNGPID